MEMQVGAKVSVNMTGLKGWGDYRYCFLDGVVESITGSGSKVRCRVKTDQFNKAHHVVVAPSRIQERRGASLGVEWEAGDEVHVREINGSTVGWWEATVVKHEEKKDTVRVRWKIQYQGGKGEEEVKLESVRAAREEEEEEHEDESLSKKRKDAAEKKEVPSKKRTSPRTPRRGLNKGDQQNHK